MAHDLWVLCTSFNGNFTYFCSLTNFPWNIFNIKKQKQLRWNQKSNRSQKWRIFEHWKKKSFQKDSKWDVVGLQLEITYIHVLNESRDRLSHVTKISLCFQFERCVTEFEKLNRIGEGTYGIVYRYVGIRKKQFNRIINRLI